MILVVRGKFVQSLNRDAPRIGVRFAIHVTIKPTSLVCASRHLLRLALEDQT